MKKSKSTKKNIGTPDRVVRALIGAALLGYGFWSGSLIAYGFALFAFYEAFASWCVFYQLLGRSSCPISTPQKK